MKKNVLSVGTVILVIFLLSIVFRIGYAVGSRPGKSEQSAVYSLQDTLELIENTEQYGGDLSYDDVCDDILDGVRDALAWLTKP